MSMRQQQAQSRMISHSKIPPVYISMATIILDDHENVNLLLFHKPLLIPCLIWSDRVEWRTPEWTLLGETQASKRRQPIKQLLAGVRSPPAPPAQEYVNPELNLTVIRGHASLSRDFLPTDLWTMKNLPSPSLQIKKVTMTETKMNHLTNYSITLEGVCSYTTIGRMISKSPFWDRDITKLTVSIKHVQIPFVGKWLT